MQRLDDSVAHDDTNGIYHTRRSKSNHAIVPELYKTRLCKHAGEECEDCRYYSSQTWLRNLACFQCKLGTRCLFAHGRCDLVEASRSLSPSSFRMPKGYATTNITTTSRLEQCRWFEGAPLPEWYWPKLSSGLRDAEVRRSRLRLTPAYMRLCLCSAKSDETSTRRLDTAIDVLYESLSYSVAIQCALHALVDDDLLLKR